MQLFLRGGAAIESATTNGTAALLARLLTEGGPRHDAVALVEASEHRAIKAAVEALGRATDDFAARRMDASVRRALAGQTIASLGS